MCETRGWSDDSNYANLAKRTTRSATPPSSLKKVLQVIIEIAHECREHCVYKYRDNVDRSTEFSGFYFTSEISGKHFYVVVRSVTSGTDVHEETE